MFGHFTFKSSQYINNNIRGLATRFRLDWIRFREFTAWHTPKWPLTSQKQMASTHGLNCQRMDRSASKGFNFSSAQTISWHDSITCSVYNSAHFFFPLRAPSSCLHFYLREREMSRDKTALPILTHNPALLIFSFSSLYFRPPSSSVRLISYVPSLRVNIPVDEPPFLAFLSHPHCHAVSLLLYLCCLFLSPAVSLSGLGVGFGDSVLWILPWLRPKLLEPHSAAAPP